MTRPQLTEFPGAYHAFNASDTKTPVIKSQAISTPAPRIRLAGTGPLVATERRPDAVPVPLRDWQLPPGGEVHAASTVPPDKFVERRVIQGK